MSMNLALQGLVMLRRYLSSLLISRRVFRIVENMFAAMTNLHGQLFPKLHDLGI